MDKTPECMRSPAMVRSSPRFRPSPLIRSSPRTRASSITDVPRGDARPSRTREAPPPSKTKVSGTSRGGEAVRGVKRRPHEEENGSADGGGVRPLRIKLKHLTPDILEELGKDEEKVVLEKGASNLLRELVDRKRTASTSNSKSGGPMEGFSGKESGLQSVEKVEGNASEKSTGRESEFMRTRVDYNNKELTGESQDEVSSSVLVRRSTRQERTNVSGGDKSGESEFMRTRVDYNNKELTEESQNEVSSSALVRRSTRHERTNVSGGDKLESHLLRPREKKNSLTVHDQSAVRKDRESEELSTQLEENTQRNCGSRDAPLERVDPVKIVENCAARVESNGSRSGTDSVNPCRQSAEDHLESEPPPRKSTPDSRITLGESSHHDVKGACDLIKWFEKPEFFRLGSYGPSQSHLCMSCRQRDASMAAFLEHIIPRDTPVRCHFCPSLCTSPCVERIHLLKSHQYACDVCTHQTISQAKLNQHRMDCHPDHSGPENDSRTFHGGPPINLTQMPKVGTIVHGILAGILREPPPDGSCPYIVASIPNSGLTKKHLLAKRCEAFLHLKAGDRVDCKVNSVMCPLCPTILRTIQDVEKHVSKTHRPEHFKRLDSTGKFDGKTRQAISLETPFCEKCQKYFHDDKSLSRHKAVVHTVSTPYQLALSQKLMKDGAQEPGDGSIKGNPDTAPSGKSQPESVSDASQCSRVQMEGTNNKTCPIRGVGPTGSTGDSVDSHSFLVGGAKSGRSTEVDSDEAIPVSVSHPSQDASRAATVPLGPDLTGTGREVHGMGNLINIPPQKPVVIRSRWEIEESWDVPDSLFSPSLLTSGSPSVVQEVESQIQKTLDDLKFEVTERGWRLPSAGGPVPTSSIVAYMKLRPVLDNLPRTPTARQNYKIYQKYKIPMGHFSPEFEEMPLFPSLRDLYMRTKGYKQSPLRILSHKEVKRLQLQNVHKKEKKMLAKHLSAALETAFLGHSIKYIRESATGPSMIRRSDDMKSQSLLSQWVGRSIRQRVQNAKKLSTPSTRPMTLSTSLGGEKMVLNDLTSMFRRIPELRPCSSSTLHALKNVFDNHGTRTAGSIIPDQGIASSRVGQPQLGAIRNTAPLGQAGTTTSVPTLTGPFNQGTFPGPNNPRPPQAAIGMARMFLLRRPSGSLPLLRQGSLVRTSTPAPCGSASAAMAQAAQLTRQSQSNPVGMPPPPLTIPPQATPPLFLAPLSALPRKPRTVSDLLYGPRPERFPARMVTLGSGQRVVLVQKKPAESAEAAKNNAGGIASGLRYTVGQYLSAAGAEPATSQTPTPVVPAQHQTRGGADHIQSGGTRSFIPSGVQLARPNFAMVPGGPASTGMKDGSSGVQALKENVPVAGEPPSNASCSTSNVPTPSVPSSLTNAGGSEAATLAGVGLQNTAARLDQSSSTDTGDRNVQRVLQVIPFRGAAESSTVNVRGNSSSIEAGGASAHVSRVGPDGSMGPTASQTAARSASSPLSSSAGTCSQEKFLNKVKETISRALVNSRLPCPPPLVQMMPRPQGEQHRATSMLVRGPRARLSPPPVVRVAPMKVTLRYRDGTSTTFQDKNEAKKMKTAPETTVKSKKKVFSSRGSRSVQWSLKKQHKRQKYERRLKQKLKLGNYRSSPVPTKTIRQAPIVTKDIVFKAVDVRLVLKVSEAVKRGRRATIKLDDYWDLFHRYVDEALR